MTDLEDFDKLLSGSSLYQDILKRLDDHTPVVHKQPSVNNGLLSDKHDPQSAIVFHDNEPMGFSQRQLQKILTQPYDEQSTPPDGIRLHIRKKLYKGLGYTPTHLENVLYCVCVNFNQYVTDEHISTLLTNGDGAKYISIALRETIRLEMIECAPSSPKPMPVLAEFLLVVTSILIHFDVAKYLRGHWRF